MEIFNHVLIGKEVSHLPCLKNKLPLEEPDTIVVHYTAGSSARGAAEYLARPGVDASAHLVIGRRGEVYQLVPFNVEAWHAGRSSLLGRSDVNHYSIGIELDNLGRLRKEGSRFVAECGKTVRPEEVFADEAGGKAAYWHRYTAAQAEALLEIVTLLESRYPIRNVVGHSDITTRKSDPGPALDAVLPSWRCLFDEETGMV